MCLGIPARIVESVDPEAGLVKAEISGVRRNVSIALCPEAGVGDWVLVHVGFALSTIDEDEARETLALLEQMGDAYEQELREDPGERDVTADHDRCITCSDFAIVATVVAVEGATATVEVEGRREEVAVELVAPVAEGDELLCHAGIALERLA